MKKIGIITYHAVCNFGAQLQAISSVGFLKRNGYEPIVIHWYPNDLEENQKKLVSEDQYNYHKNFSEQNMPLTKLCRTENELLQVIDEDNLDAIILGSDALFKYLPISERIKFSLRKLRFVDIFTSDRGLTENPFWGSFIPKLKKQIPVIVFSVSSQDAAYKKVNKQEYDELKRALERFTYITVRDEWTKQMVRYFLGDLDIPVTPDPVFSFNQNNYLPVPTRDDLLKKYGLPEKYVLLSFNLNYLRSGFIRKLEVALKSNAYTAVAFPMPEGLKDYGLSHKISTPLSPLDWYYLIKYANGYIGERMHPVLVALHNGVPFFCFDHYGLKEYFVPIISKFNVPFISKFTRKIHWDTSKIYHILSKANLLKYAIPYNDCKKITPLEIVDKLLSFDTKSAMMFSEEYKNLYERYMHNILKLV